MPRKFKRMPLTYRMRLADGDWRFNFSDGISARVVRTNDQRNHIEWRVYIDVPQKILVPRPFRRMDEALDYMRFEYDLPVIS